MTWTLNDLVGVNCELYERHVETNGGADANGEIRNPAGDDGYEKGMENLRGLFRESDAIDPEAAYMIAVTAASELRSRLSSAEDGDEQMQLLIGFHLSAQALGATAEARERS